MRRRGGRRAMAGLALLWLLWPGAGARADELSPAGREGWRLMQKLQFNEAVEEMERAGPLSPRGRMGLAMALLNTQPRSQADVERAAVILRQLSEGAADEEVASWALYFLGRIDQAHRKEVDEQAALVTYGKLIERFPASEAAELARIKRGLLELYSPGDDVDRAGVLGRLEEELPLISSAPTRQQLHHVIAEGLLFFQLSRERALDHFIAAHKLGEFIPNSEPGALYRIAALAQDLGRREVAARHFRALVERHPTSPMLYEATQRLAELEPDAEGGRP